jgi:hypothetical protein
VDDRRLLSRDPFVSGEAQQAMDVGEITQLIDQHVGERASGSRQAALQDLGAILVHLMRVADGLDADLPAAGEAYLQSLAV